MGLEACDDEDAAIDFLLEGFRAQPEPRCSALSSPANHQQHKHEKEHEEYPSLCPALRQNDKSRPVLITLGQWRSNRWFREPKATAQSEEFPSLPVSKPRTPVNNVVKKSCAPPLRRSTGIGTCQLRPM